MDKQVAQMDVAHGAKAVGYQAHPGSPRRTVGPKIGDLQIRHVPELHVAQEQGIQVPAFGINPGLWTFAVLTNGDGHRLAVLDDSGALRLELPGVAGSRLEQQRVAGLQGLGICPFQASPRLLWTGAAVGIVPGLTVHMVGYCANRDYPERNGNCDQDENAE